MLYSLLVKLADNFTVLNVFKYITFRAALAIFTSFVFCYLFGDKIITWLKSLQADGQPIRSDGPESHFAKKGTPTMGGIMMISSILLSSVLWADLTNSFVLASLLVFCSYAFLGFLDDYKKLRYKNSKGVSGKFKLLWQFGFALIAILIISLATSENLRFTLTFPFFKEFMLSLGWFYIPFAMVVVTGASNAVNLTDGLDGLASGPVIITSACFGIISYLVGHAVFSSYLMIPQVSGTGELTVLCAAIIGAALGFLWFNAPPASVFMGDIGSLALGGIIGVISVATKHEIVLAIVGGLFVIEALSVIIQVLYFKATKGKRFFKMAPLHHHFEKKGWSETKVVMRFWILSVLFALIGLATLKLR